MKAKSVRQLLESAAHIEQYRPNIGWVVADLHAFYRVYPSFGGGKPFDSISTWDIRSFSREYRIVTVKGKAIA